MITPLLKICGLRRPEQAAEVARLGADAIGVIAVPGSPRWLEPAARPALFAAVAAARPSCRGVLVVADPPEAELAELTADSGHTVLQLHGQETPQQCADLRRRLGGGLEIWKALRIRRPADLERARQYTEVVDALLVDAWVPDQLGGTGHRIPSEWLEGFRPELPWWLAGGIRPQGVARVLERVSPDGLDASSGVEHSPGEKDLALVEDLVRAVKGPAFTDG